MGLQINQQTTQCRLIGRAIGGLGQVAQSPSGRAQVALGEITQGQNAVGRHQFGQRGPDQGQLGRHGVVIDVLRAHRIAVAIALKFGRDLGLEVAHAARHQGHAITQQIGQQGV